MSLKAIIWVMEDAPVKSPGELLVLYALAERAHDDGRCAWPSQEWIAHRARCSTRTVRNHLKSLEGQGLIRRGNQKFVAHLRSDRRPVVWDLDLTRKREEDSSPRGSSAGKSESVREEDPSTAAGKSESVRPETPFLQTVLEPSVEPSLNHPPVVPQGGQAKDPDRFAEFYEVYPRRVGKIAAEKAWKKATKDVDPQRIIDGAVRFSAWCEATGQETRFIAHPATWLNHGRWEDELEWPASPQQQSGNDLAAWGAPSTQGFGDFGADPFGNLRGPVIDHEESS